MSVPGTRKARPAPSRPERAWAEMPTGRRRRAAAPPDRHLQRPDRTLEIGQGHRRPRPPTMGHLPQ
jgi:hypothetical protein